MNESSLTKDHGLASAYTSDRLLCIPTNVGPKTAISDPNGPLWNGHFGRRGVDNGVSKLGSQFDADMTRSSNPGQISSGNS
jgi:hypothetical protein